MKKILVPVDFSRASKNAMAYAIQFASEYKGCVHLLHAYRNFSSTNAPVIVIPQTDHKAESTKQFMESFLSEIKSELNGKYADVEIGQELVMGLATDEIAEKTKTGGCDFVVMGKTGESKFTEKILGSVTTATIQRSHCPVLAVPENVTYNGINRILFATNILGLDDKILKEVIEFALYFRARIYFVHVWEKNEADRSMEEELFEKIFEAYEEPPIPFEIRTIHGESVENALNEFVAGHKIDLMVMVTQHRSLWQRLFHKSLTREMALHMNVPLLVLHADDDIDL